MTKALTSRKMQRRHAERIQTTLIIDRVQAHVLGELIARPQVARKIIERVLAAVGADMPAEKEMTKLVTEAVSLMTRAGMDMSQVRGAEVLLNKRLPNLANTEYRAEVQHNHTVVLPAGMSPEQWQAQVRGQARQLN